MCVLSDAWDRPYVQVDGTAEVLHMPPIATVGSYPAWPIPEPGAPPNLPVIH